MRHFDLTGFISARLLRRLTTAGGAILLLSGGLTGGGCSLGLNTTAVQCLSEAECVSRGAGFENTTCSPMTKTCVPVDPNAGLCKLNADCVNAGGPAICRKTDSKCVQLQTAECPTVFARPTDILNDKAVIVGAMTPANDAELGAIMEKTIGLVQQDFNTAVPGLPSADGSPGSRPLIFVGCNEFGAGIDGLLRGANHLVKDLQTQVVIGPVDSQNVIQTATKVMLPNKILNILPTSAISALSDLPNPAAPTPLLWRASYSDAGIAGTIGEFVKQVLEPQAIALGIVPAGQPVKVLILAEGSIVGLSAGQKTQAAITFNGKTAAENAAATPPNFAFVNFGDQRDAVNNPDPNAKIASAIAAVYAFAPHIIIHTSAIIGVTKIFIPLESLWPAGVPRPLHVTGLSSWASAPLTGYLASPPGKATGLRKRVFGVRGLSPALDPAIVSNWTIRFKTAYPEFMNSNINPLAYTVFDAAYLAAYSVAAVGSKPLTGPNAAQGLMQLLPPGAPIQASPDDISKALGILGSGQAIDLNGLSGNLNFDPKTGGVGVDTEIYCSSVDLSGTAVGFQSSGFKWDHLTGTGSGTVACPP